MRRPLRDRFEGKVTDEIPSGPFGKAGQGDLIGAGGFLAVESTRPFFTFIPGVKQPGYGIVSHSAESVPEGERHELIVTAISEDVAEFVAQYTSAPSNVDYIVTDVKLESTEVMTERSTYSTYKMTVLLEIEER